MGNWLKLCMLAALAGYFSKNSGKSPSEGAGMTKQDKMDTEHFDIYKPLGSVSRIFWILHPQKAIHLIILQKSMEIAWKAAKKLRK